jgi:integrase
MGIVETKHDTPSASVNQVLDRFQRDYVPTLAPRTQKDYARHITLLRGMWGERIADEIPPREFGEFIHVRDRGKVQRVRQLAVLSAAFSQAVGVYWMIKRNPLRDVKRPRFKPRDRVVEQFEVDAVCALAPKKIALGVRLALKTGQRQGDILRFRWDDIKEIEGVSYLEVRQSKTGKRLAIRVDAELEAILDDCWKARKRDNPYILGSRSGKQYVAEGYRASWQRTIGLYVRLGGKHWQFRDLRATCATRMETPELARRLLGHTNIAMTMKVYRRGLELVESLPSK